MVKRFAVPVAIREFALQVKALIKKFTSHTFVAPSAAEGLVSVRQLSNDLLVIDTRLEWRSRDSDLLVVVTVQNGRHV